MGDDPDAAPVAASLNIELPAVPATVSVMRDAVTRWLTGLRWPEDAAADIVLAVNEAITNAIEHGCANRFPGLVRLDCAVAVEGMGRRVAIVVADDGRWLQRDQALRYRGLGLRLMRRLMATVEVHRGETGTVIEMRSSIVPNRVAAARNGSRTRSQSQSQSQSQSL